MPTEKIYAEVKELVVEQGGEPTFAPDKRETEVRDYVKKRVQSMVEHRKNVLGKDIEKIWRDADTSYIPQELQVANAGKRFESDDELGLRARLVPIGDSQQAWRSKNSEPTLLVKIHTALSVIIDRDPKAFFKSLTKKYDATTKLASSLWESSWATDRSSEQLKLFVFNLAKYGWAAGRTYPRIIKRSKKVLTSFDAQNPEKNTYDERVITDYNGVHRENLDPYRTWMDEMATPNDPFSIHDWYFEKDYSYDAAALEFGAYANWKHVSRSARMSRENKSDAESGASERDDIVTIGFYESATKDLYCIYVPSQDIVLYESPLPNDDGKLSLWQGYWLIRDARTPYGIGLYEIIRQKKSLYDKMMNMTMDQLVLSIYKMFFYSGTTNLIGDGSIEITPGKGVQLIGDKPAFMEVPGPGKEAFDGLQVLKSGIDDDSGITPTIEGQVTGKTLGEILHAKEAALKRMNVPLTNIADALTQEAYVSLSWLAQTLSTPEVKEFSDERDLLRYEQETGINRFEIREVAGEDGSVVGYQASFLPEISLNVDLDEQNNLIESRESRFFQIGKDIQPQQLRWEGVIQVIPRSILAPSLALEKQGKLEVFNILVPLLGNPPELFAKAAQQLLKAQDEDVEDWLPQAWVEFLETGIAPVPAGMPGLPGEGGGETMQAQAGMAQNEAQTVVPRGEVSSTPPESIAGGMVQEPRG